VIIERGKTEAVSYELVTLSGRIVQQGRLESAKHTLDISDQTPGIYFIRLRTGDRYVHFKLIVE
jgi:hypothetical protein